MTVSSGIVPVVELTLEEYDSLKRKEFVFDIEKAKLESRVKKGSWVDEDRRILYGVPTRDEMNAEVMEKLRKRMEKEKENELIRETISDNGGTFSSSEESASW